MDREVLTTVTFKENCEYQSSTITRKIALPKQTVEVSISINNLTNSSRNNLINKPFFNDKLEFTAHVYQTYTDDNDQIQENNITVGRIVFYYLPEDSSIPIRLNKDADPEVHSCELNSGGNASIVYRPSKKGQIYAQYIDDNDFYEGTVSPYYNVDMLPIPVTITIDAPPVLVDVDDEVELTAHVTNDATGEPMNYGIVTFLHYQTSEDVSAGRHERVIGNPVMVVDGKATIRYVPVETDDYGEPYQINPPYRERIVAVYNFSSKLYGEQWRYYKEERASTDIAICSRNSITLGLNSNIDNETAQHQYYEGDNIDVYGVITDKDNHTFPIKTTGDFKANLTLHIRGHHLHPKVNPDDIDNFNLWYSVSERDYRYIEYSKDINATYVNSEGKYYFNKVINDLLPGYYTITASCTKQSGIDDKIYDDIDESNILYIQVNHNKRACQITLSSNSNTVHIDETINLLKGEVTNLPNNYMSILNNKRCYFHIPKLNKTYTGTLKYSNNKLIGESNEPISFNQAGLYYIYMYIPSGIYTNNFNGHNQNTIDFYLKENISNGLLIQVDDIIKLNLSIDVQKKNSPGSIEYRVKGQYISKPTTINIYLNPIDEGNISLVNTVTLTKEVYEFYDTISNIEAGEYRLEVEAVDNTYTSKNFSININNLQAVVGEDSKEILGTPQNTINVFLYSRDNIRLIDTSKIKAYIQSADTAFDITKAKQANIQSITMQKDGSLSVMIKTGLYKQGEWWVMISYDGGEGFDKVNCSPQKFKTFLYTPNIKLIPYEDRYDIRVYYDNDKNYINNNLLLIRLQFLKANSPVAQGAIVTDEKGYGSFKDYKYSSLNWWTDWDNVVFIFEPYDTDNINIMKNQPSYNALKNKYTYNEESYVFDAWDMTNTNQPDYNIGNQIIGNEEQALYIGYKPCEIRITKPL